MIARILHLGLRISFIQLWGQYLDIKIKNKGKVVIGRRLQTRTNIHLMVDNGFLKIQDNVFMNHNVSITSVDKIEIESNVTIANNVVIIDHDHDLHNKNGFISAPILIKEGTWIGANAVILKGVTLGTNSVVAAGSVVIKSVPDNTIVGGIPARFIKNI
ncbi:acyltransferase [Xylanibacter muris]|uniref:acyltransferase n=1 Tax=Xylanibacter muris TaxID=2736290 RepID=UPI0025580F05|nr:acyltransferase [Xylanibacter muris]